MKYNGHIYCKACDFFLC